LIEKIISTKPVQVRVLLYCSVKDDVPGTYDGLVSRKINSLNKRGYPGSVRAQRQKPTSMQQDSWEYSHHQKFVVVDGSIGFLGGIDLSYGRWETPEFDVVVDPSKFVSNDMYNPCVVRRRPPSLTEEKIIADFDFAAPYKGLLIDEGCQPRMPWQDVHIKIEGPSVVDIHRNFVRRWNAHLMFGGGYSSSPDWITRAWLEKIGAWKRLSAVQPRVGGGAQVQIVRSVSNGHLKQEGEAPEDLLLFVDQREKNTWGDCLKSWSGAHQDNILNAMANCIRSADNYIYIETQFFISKFGTWSGPTAPSKYGEATFQRVVDSSKIGNEDDGIKNVIVDALAERIVHHIKAGTPFHVYLVVPTHPEGLISDDAVQKQHRLALLTIKHGSNSLINRIKHALKTKKRSPDEWPQFLTVLNMRNFGATVQYARDPKTFNEDFDREIGRFVITEQIYIHSKLMIVDDAVAIIGSANTNDRSLTGNGDTEIAAVIVDTEGVELKDLGSPTMKVQTRKFARELRRQLWLKHFGFMMESADAKNSKYFRSTARARKNENPSLDLEHPPRTRTVEVLIKEACGVEWKTIIDKPCDFEVVKAIQAIAQKNSKVYEHVFLHTPRNSFRTFAASNLFNTLPYPLSFDALGTTYLEQRRPPLDRAIFKALTEDRITAASQFWEQDYQKRVALAGFDDCYSGVVPPALQPPFMTCELLAHQRAALNSDSYGRMYQLYGNKNVHDVTAAIKYLKTELTGFFVLAPLEWAMDTIFYDNPTKTQTIDISSIDNVTTLLVQG
jgi:phospholipase D1/2